MPARRSTGARKAARPKKDLIKQVQAAHAWSEVVDVLCEYHELGDLKTRHSLKSVHKTYPQVSKRLNATYREYNSNEKIICGLMMLWGRMCTDSVLRDKLLEEGYLEKVLFLLNTEQGRPLALNILTTVTHHGGNPARCRVMRSVYRPVRDALKSALERKEVREVQRCVVILTHCAIAVLQADNPKDRAIELDVSELITLCISSISIPHATLSLFHHALGFVQSACMPAEGGVDIKSQPYDTAVRLFVAVMGRSEDIQDRIEFFYSLLSFVMDADGFVPINNPMHKLRLMTTGIPPDVKEALTNFGMDRSEFYGEFRVTPALTQAYMKCTEDHDLVALGFSLARFVLMTEFCIINGGYAEVTGSSRSYGLPFERNLADALPLCAKALREAGPAVPANLDAADCLDLKYYFTRGMYPTASSLAAQAIERNPKQPFFHYIAASSTMVAKDSVQHAKHGLRLCERDRSVTPYVRMGLLYLAFDKCIHVAQRAISDVLEEKPGAVLEEAIAYLTSAMEDSAAYIKFAAPDTRRLKEAICVNILTQLILRGGEISADLKEVQPLLDRYRTTEHILEALYGAAAPTQLELALDMATTQYASACATFGSAVKEITAPVAEASEQAVAAAELNDITAWLESLELADSDGHPRESCEDRTPRKLAPQELYRCSCCRNPSAALKRCARCRKTVYCGPHCQKTHWSEHKKDCLVISA